MAAILLIEDDITFSGMLVGFLSGKNFNIQAQHRGKEGLKSFKSQKFDLVLLDYRLPDGNGLDFLQLIQEHDRNTPVIIMTSFNDVRTAVKAIQAGAVDYILKPVYPDELLLTINRALHGGHKWIDDAGDDFIEGETPASKNMHQHVHRVAPTQMSVIIEGESGTGKEWVAKMIHRLSARSHGPFVAIDCGAISRDLAASELFGHVKGSFTGAIADTIGKFEAAHTGTLFLDEVGNLSYDTQVKLLRAIQERVIHKIGSNKPTNTDVRIITATNDDLARRVKQGDFREDLFHRLNEFTIRVPPLRDRGDDLVQFADLFRKQANRELNRLTSGFHPTVIDIFTKYQWPGNLRELRNVVRRAVLFTDGPVVTTGSLPVEMVSLPAADEPVLRESHDLRMLQEKQERELITKTLQEVGYNKSKAARLLNIDRKTLYAKMEKYQLD